jgi:hypothetical protein
MSDMNGTVCLWDSFLNLTWHILRIKIIGYKWYQEENTLGLLCVVAIFLCVTITNTMEQSPRDGASTLS